MSNETRALGSQLSPLKGRGASDPAGRNKHLFRPNCSSTSPEQHSTNHRAVPVGCLKVHSPGMVPVHWGQTGGCRGEGLTVQVTAVPTVDSPQPCPGTSMETGLVSCSASSISTLSTEYFLLDCWDLFCSPGLQGIFSALSPAHGASCPEDIQFYS